MTPPVYRMADIFGYSRLSWSAPPVYGQQLPSMIAEHFDKDGRLVERRECPPSVRIVYGDADV